MSSSIRYAFYLACSWLWCLGGFLPLILSRDYGWPALAAFTIFNVAGASAMGFYFKHRAQQKIFESNNKCAIALFSYVTIAYQLFFVAWLGSMLGQPLILIAVLSIAFIIYHSRGLITYWAVLFYLLCIGLLISFLNGDWQPVELSSKIYWPHAIVPLAIGFIFSPYLDITFHRAYRESGNPKLSFALGFGVLFLSLLGFVFVYAGSLGNTFFTKAVPGAVIYPVICFLVLQIAFTVAAHCNELSTQQYIKPRLLAGAIAVFSMFSFGLLKLVEGNVIPWGNLPLEETIYKGFLFFYSLVFPLYLLLGKSKPIYFWILGICTPGYSIGFLIGGEYSYSLSIAVLIMLAVILFKRQAYAATVGRV